MHSQPCTATFDAVGWLHERENEFANGPSACTAGLQPCELFRGRVIVAKAGVRVAPVVEIALNVERRGLTG